jgi:hypothetical protein
MNVATTQMENAANQIDFISDPRGFLNPVPSCVSLTCDVRIPKAVLGCKNPSHLSVLNRLGTLKVTHSQPHKVLA